MKTDSDTREFSPEAGLKVIYEMITNTRADIGKNYFYFLFWGYLVAFTCLAEYILIQAVHYPKHYLVWPALMTTGFFITAIFSFLHSANPKTKTFIGTAMSFFWIGWFICFIILLFFIIYQHEYRSILPITLAMYGLGVFVTGGIVKFRPLIMGAIFAWTASIISYFAEYPTQLLIALAVVVIAYIIPGHLLKIKSEDNKE